MENRRPNSLKMNHAKAKNFKKSIGQLVKHLRPYYPLIITGLILAIFSTAFNLLGPDIIKNLSKVILRAVSDSSKVNMKEISKYGVLLLSLYVLSFLDEGNICFWLVLIILATL